MVTHIANSYCKHYAKDRDNHFKEEKKEATTNNIGKKRDSF